MMEKGDELWYTHSIQVFVCVTDAIECLCKYSVRLSK